MKCESCGKKFKRNDDIVASNAQGGGMDYVHEECYDVWLREWDHSYGLSYEELLEELKEN